MPQTDPANTDWTPEAIQAWLTGRIAHFLEMPDSEIDPDIPLAEYGLESLYAFALSGEIEDTLGLAVEPTLVWDVDTVNALTAHLCGLWAERAAL
ncbi:acyl carrier protein [Kitasatospora sp. NPDC004289]